MKVEKDGGAAAERGKRRETIAEREGRGAETGSEGGLEEAETERGNGPVQKTHLEALGVIGQDGWLKRRRTGRDRRR